MTYDQAAEKYLELRREVERIEKEAKAKAAELKKMLLDIENWFTLRADEDGLKNVPTMHGTAYWSTHNSATVADQGVFREFCIENKAWDLMETRASKTAVKSYIDGHGTPPPGVNFSSVRVFNLKPANANKE